VTSSHPQIKKAATLCLLALSALAHAQTPTPAPQSPPKDQSFYVNQPPAIPKPPRNVIVIDPAHGGDDTGAQLPNNAVEKEVTQAFATRLKPLLAAAGFTPLTTRDTDANLSTDIRAGIANHSRAIACLILHATSSGSGIHVITSSLSPNTLDDPHATIPWNTAQSASIPQSLALANEIGLSLEHAKLPVILGRASLRPLDNLVCPAVAIEIAPLTPTDAGATPVSDANYQQTVAKAIVAALTSWRTHTLAAAGVSR
jgi:N-acetylmuramoyl-L-alanine amidase